MRSCVLPLNGVFDDLDTIRISIDSALTRHKRQSKPRLCGFGVANQLR